ncbi:unnamed protein product [Rotaria sp. Silwood2]|nr:unnamed protein product [Rotaria sp. Silwood2]CAF3346388.1 unnamed protein product [Rotaria sp. Silwood2]CAF4090223.1 unnamed protein product [Rotaria sp. Silwood2]CAF4441310.1 unnamed protein product [Rotaria sp. Silwood2]
MISHTAIFWSFLIFLIPSIICSLLVLYHLLFDRTLRYGLNNHVIIIVLIIGLVCDVTLYPWMLYYYRYDGKWNRSPIFCIIWAFIDWGLYITHTVLFAWATIERHILIFHDQWVSTKIKRFFFHYLPLIALLFYCLIFYLVLDFFPPCENLIFDFNIICVYFCVRQIYAFAMWDTIGHQIIAVLTILIFSIALFMRVLWQKHRVNQSIQWRKCRKMTIQLLSISFLYLIFFFPATLMTFMYMCGLPHEIGADFYEYANFSSYYMILLLPFVCILSLPELRTKSMNILHLRRQVRHIVPT